MTPEETQKQVDLVNQLSDMYKNMNQDVRDIADQWGFKASMTKAASDEVATMNDKIKQGYIDNAKLAMDLTNIETLRGTKYYDQAMTNMNLDQSLTETVKRRAQVEMDLIEARATGNTDKIAELEAEQDILDTREKNLTAAIETKKQEDMIKAKKDEMMKPMKDMQDKWTDIKANAVAFGQTMMTSQGALAILSMGVLALGAAMFKAFMDTEAAIQKIYETTGLSVSQVGYMRDQANGLRQEFASMGMGFDQILATQQAFISSFGNMAGMSKGMVEDLGAMQYMFGLTAEDSAKVMQNFMGMTDGSAESAKNMMMMVNAAAGDNYADAGQVMKDIANLSGEALAYFSGNPKQLAEAAAFARGLGIEISKMTGAADNLLNLEQSLTSEMEAEMLIGRNLNLDKMRQAAFNGDMVTMTKEILKNTGGLNNFNKMNVMQQKAMAQAMGMSVEDLRTMLTTEERMKNLTAEQRKELEAIGAAQEEQKEMTFEEMKAQKERQVATQKFQNMMSEIMASLQEVFLPVVETIAGFLSNWGGAIKLIIGLLATLAAGYYIILGIEKARAAFAKMRELSQNKELNFYQKIKSFAGIGDKTKTAPKPSPKPDATKGGGKGQMPGAGMNMGQVLKGAAAMLIMAAALWVMAKALQEFNSVDWMSVAKGAVGLLILAGIVFLLGQIVGPILVGSVAMLILAGALWVMGAALLMFNDIDWMSLAKAGVALLGLAGIAALLGLMIIPLLLGAYGIAILSGALMLFSASTALLAVTGPPTLEFLQGLMELDGAKLREAASGIGAIGLALAAFGVGSLVAGIGAFFGGDPVAHFKRFAEIGPDLQVASTAITHIAESVNLFGDIKTESAQLLEAGKNINAYAGALMAASGAQTAFAATAAMATPFMAIAGMVSGFLGGGGEKDEEIKVSEMSELRKDIQELKETFAGMQINIDGKRAGDLIFSATPGTRLG